MVDQLPGSEGEVLGQLGQKFGAAHTTIPLFTNRSASGVDPFDVAEAPDRSLVRIGRRYPACLELASSHLDVEPELGIDFVFDATAPDPRTQAAAEVMRPTG
jgi:hypothetical protein